MSTNQEFGDYELILGNEDNNTLTGTEAANIFVHQGATNDLIEDFNPSEDIIVLTAGKVSESMNSSNGNDVIFKIADGNDDLGTITIQDGRGKFCTVYDADYINKNKNDFLEFSNAYIKAVVKTFEEDADVKSILTNGANSTVLAEIKAANPELATQIANAIKLSYDTGVKYLESGMASNSSSNANVPEDMILNSSQKTFANSSDDTFALDFFNDTISTVDYGATALKSVEEAQLLNPSLGTKLSNVTAPLANSATLASFVAYNTMLYDENIVPAFQNQGHYGGSPLEKLARIRSYNTEAFDGTVKSTIGLVALIGGSVAVGVFGAPVLATATVCFVVPTVWSWAYDKFTAPQLDAEEKKLESLLKDNFNNFVNGTSEAAYNWLHAIDTKIDYIKSNSESNVFFYGTPGNDSLRNYGKGVFIASGAGNDKIYNEGSNVRIVTSAGNDSIYSRGSNVTIDGGAGNDSIHISGDSTSIDAGEGDDFISIYYGSNNSIDAGEGDDFISIYYGSNNSIDAGEGNNTVYGSGTIKTGSGDDSINGSGLIEAGEGNNTVYGSGTIKTGSGDDSINGSGLIDAGEGNNTVSSGNNSTIKTGKGNDSIYIYGGSNSIDAGEGNNTVRVGSNSTIKIVSGDNFISISGGSNSIDAGEGNNTVYANSWYSSVSNTIKTGGGDDFISIRGGSNSIDAGEGNNTVYANSWYSSLSNTIKTGSGDDLISIRGSNNSIDAGEGNNTVYGSGTIKTGSGNDFITNYVSITFNEQKQEYEAIRSPDNSTVDSGDGDDTLYASSNYGSINGGKGNDSIRSRWCHDVTILGGAGNDKIFNDGGDIDSFYAHVGSDFVTIDGGSGADFIKNSGTNISINGGDGNDSIYNVGEGEDSLAHNDAENVTIVGGSGNDYIYNEGSNVSINAGDGDDVIALSDGGNNLINAGSGKNTIIGYGTSDTLQISGSYVVTRDNSDVLISFGEDYILLDNFAEDKININGKIIKVDDDSDENESAWELKGTKATCKQNGKTVVTVSGVKSKDGISLSGTTVKLSAASLGTSKVTVSKGYTLELADDVPAVELNGTTWSLKKTTATLNASKTAGYSCDGKTITYTAASNGAALATITGVNSISGIEISGNVITLPTNALGTSAIKLTKGNYTLALADKNLTTATKTPSWIISGTKASYKNSTSEYYSIASNGKTISYVKAAPDKNAKDFITLNGINKNLKASDIAIDSENKTVTLSANALNKKTVTIGGTYGYSLALADDVTKSNVSVPAWSLKKTTATLSQNQSVGYVCDGSTITYSSKKADVTLATITGVNSINGIEISGNVITLPTNALGTSAIKLTKGNYTLALADKNLTTATKTPSWIVSGTKASYKNSTSEYYSIASNGKTISYVKAAPDKNAKDFITLNGINKNLKASDVAIDSKNKTVTLSANALNKKTITIGGTYGYSLALADDVTKSNVSAPTWSLKKTTATLSQNQSVGYVCDGSTITYSSKKADVTLATITGVNSINGIKVSGNVITLPTNALGTSAIKLTKGNYTLALADENLTTATKTPSWIISGTKASYKNFTSEYYSIASNGKTISYVKAAPDKNAKDFITLNGVNKNVKASDIVIDSKNKTVTLSANALNKKTVTIGGTYGYSLALADDVTKSAVTKTNWSVKSTKATLQTSTTAGYSCDGDKITYTAAKNGKAVATISGVKKGIAVTNGTISGITVDEDDKTITLSANALTNKITIGGSYEFDFAADYNKALITGSNANDSIKVSGTDMTVKGGKGDDSLWGDSGADTFIYAKGDGRDVIYGFDDTDMLEITGKFTATYDSSANTVAFNVGSTANALTLKNFTATTFNVNGTNYQINGSKLVNK